MRTVVKGNWGTPRHGAQGGHSPGFSPASAFGGESQFISRTSFRNTMQLQNTHTHTQELYQCKRSHRH